MDVAVVGTDDFVTGFALAGVKNIYSAEENLDGKVEEVLKQSDIGILVMQQEQFKSLNNKAKKMLEKAIRPVLVLISDEGKEEDIRKMIKRSLGVDLWG